MLRKPEDPPLSTAARDHLETLVGREIRTISGRRNTILVVEEKNVIVATSKSPDGRPVPIEWVQRAMELLAHDREITIDVDTVGYRSAFIGAVLATLLPGAVVQPTSPPRVALRDTTH
jgi:hypothetical protein